MCSNWNRLETDKNKMKINFKGIDCTTKRIIMSQCIDFVLMEKKAIERKYSKQLNLTIHANQFNDIYGEIGVMANNYFDLEICIDKSVSFMGQIIILCHELVHVSQCVSKKLYYCEEREVYIWKNKAYPYINTCFLERPWEHEAIAMERRLAYEFCVQAGYNSKEKSDWYYNPFEIR